MGKAAPVDRTQSQLEAIWREVRYVAYTPRGFSVVNGAVTAPTAASIREDLRLLRERFDGLVTYSAWNGHEQIAPIAAELGYRSLLLGLWDPGTPGELEAAIATARAHPGLVHAVLVGNEGLVVGRYRLDTLLAAMDRVRAALPGVAVSTVEPYGSYLREDLAPLLGAGDFLCPNIHPIYEAWFEPGRGEAELVEFVLGMARRLRAQAGQPLLLHETGMPSGPASAGFDPARQRAFWELLETRGRPEDFDALVWFEAFDAPWKQREAERFFGGTHPEEAHWGLYTRAGEPKAALSLPTLAPLR